MRARRGEAIGVVQALGLRLHGRRWPSQWLALGVLPGRAAPGEGTLGDAGQGMNGTVASVDAVRGCERWQARHQVTASVRPTV